MCGIARSKRRKIMPGIAKSKSIFASRFRAIFAVTSAIHAGGVVQHAHTRAQERIDRLRSRKHSGEVSTCSTAERAPRELPQNPATSARGTARRRHEA